MEQFVPSDYAGGGLEDLHCPDARSMGRREMKCQQRTDSEHRQIVHCYRRFKHDLKVSTFFNLIYC